MVRTRSGINTNKNQQQIMAANVAAVPAAPAVVKKSLSKWQQEGLDISDAGFSKLHAKESKFDSSRKKYDLEPEKFQLFCDDLIEKVQRMHAKEVFTIQDANQTDCMVLTEYTKLTETQVKAKRDGHWPATDPTFATQAAADKYTDKQIKIYP